jgi:hypothetical protein
MFPSYTVLVDDCLYFSICEYFTDYSFLVVVVISQQTPIRSPNSMIASEHVSLCGIGNSEFPLLLWLVREAIGSMESVMGCVLTTLYDSFWPIILGLITF